MKRWYYVLFPAICLAAGGVVGFLIKDSVAAVFPMLKKPPLTPPGVVFPIVWTILYVLMGLGMARVAAVGGSRSRKALRIWIVQLILNVSWSLLFFNGGLYLTAFACLAALWFAIVRMILAFHAISPSAARWQVPYLVWVSFAGYLNLGVWVLNG